MLDSYRRDFAEFHTACAREHYLFHSGQKESLNIATIYERYSHLFERGSISQLKLETVNSNGHSVAVSLRRLLAFAAEQFLEDSVKQLTERISDYEARATVTLPNRELTFQGAAVAITTEGDRDTRRAIYARRIAVIEASNDLRSERLVKHHEAARTLGYSGYVELFGQLRGINYADVARQASSLLLRTEPVYVAQLAGVLKRELGVAVEQAERSDAMYLLHLTRFDNRFPPDSMLDVYRETMAGLGINVESQKNITVDSEPRPRKNPRAFCMPISVPDDVRLVIRPAGGQSDYQALLHESGHAQHYGWASEQLPAEFKYTGDYALTETYAFLFNHLISDGEWLATFLGLTDNEEFVRSVMLTRLVSVRRYVAKLNYELHLHADEDLTGSAALYAELQIAATRFKAQPAEFLFDLDDFFYAASYLRAWAFEILLREELKTRFGRRWWSSSRAGDLLKQLWETGDSYTADEMAAQVGLGAISFEPLIDEFNRVLS
jgi:hypothetical protein